MLAGDVDMVRLRMRARRGKRRMRVEDTRRWLSGDLRPCHVGGRRCWSRPPSVHGYLVLLRGRSSPIASMEGVCDITETDLVVKPPEPSRVSITHLSLSAPFSPHSVLREVQL
jgi:hypothetical protein